MNLLQTLVSGLCRLRALVYDLRTYEPTNLRTYEPTNLRTYEPTNLPELRDIRTYGSPILSSLTNNHPAYLLSCLRSTKPLPTTSPITSPTTSPRLSQVQHGSEESKDPVIKQQALREMEKHFRTVDEDAVVLSADRIPVPVLVFLKGDPIKLPAKLSAADDVAKTFETSTKTLYATDPARKNAYPIIPTIPPDTDVRHVHHHLRKEAFPANEFGTTYLIVQQEQGHDDRVCASGVILGEGARQMTQAEAEKEAQRVAKKLDKAAPAADPAPSSAPTTKLPISFTRMSRVARFYKDMEPNFECAAAIFKAIDPDLYQEYADCYERTICRLDGLKNVQSPSSVWCSMVLITNLNVDPHRDRTDRKDGWVLVQCFGDFDEEGGQTVCPELGLIFNMRPGDIILMRSAMLEHYVRPWLTGKRVSCVYWTHAGMFKYGVKKNKTRRKQQRRAPPSAPVPAPAPTTTPAPAPAPAPASIPETRGDKFDWAKWRDQQEADEQTLGVGEGVGSGYRAGGVNWGQEVGVLEDSDDEAGGKVKGGKRKKAKAKAKTKAKAKAKPAGQTASKRDYGEVDTSNDDDDDDDDGDVSYKMATVDDPYGLAMDLQRVL